MEKRCNKFSVTLVLLMAISSVVVGQKNRFIPQMIRVYEDNDFFLPPRAQTDRYYTNGTRIDLFYTKSQRKFLSKLLIPLSTQSDNLYGVGLTHQMYTPTDITQSQVIVGDRPYSATLYASHSLTSSSDSLGHRLTTEISFGVMGPSAFGKEVQTWIHDVFNYAKPQGWDNQLKDGIIINYLIQYEKRIVQPSPKIEIIGLIEANVGTLSNNLALGLTFRAGLFSSYFSNYEKVGMRKGASERAAYQKVQFYFYMRPLCRAVMDNSLLEGAGFYSPGTNVYAISKDEVKRVLMQFEYGVVMGYKRFGISSGQKLKTAEFTNAYDQQIANITLFVGI